MWLLNGMECIEPGGPVPNLFQERGARRVPRLPDVKQGSGKISLDVRCIDSPEDGRPRIWEIQMGRYTYPFVNASC